MIPERIWLVRFKGEKFEYSEPFEQPMFDYDKECEAYIRAPQWVSVEDGLPETNEGYATAYLVMAKRYEEQDILFYGIGYHWESGWEVKGTYAQVVTHWMPLPAPPEVE